MKDLSNDQKVKFLKRKAKKLSKESGIRHTEALEIIAKDSGYPTWKKLVNNEKPETIKKSDDKRPNTPEFSVLNYHNAWTGAIIGQRPNARMSVRRHTRVGAILQELLFETEYHKRAHKPIRDIRITLDTWLGYEYDENSLNNAEFNRIYYANGKLIGQTYPSKKRQEELKRLLRRAKILIDRSYHDCKPIDALHQRFEIALKSLDHWPKTAKPPVFEKGRIPAGKFVRLKSNKKVCLLFHHDIGTQVVTCYSDAGHFYAGRHEVSVLKNQPNIRDFKPMRLRLPYGKWFCADGSEVLFNRDYCPIWKKLDSGEIIDIDPSTQIDYEDSEHYYYDRTAPYSGDLSTLELCLSVLKDWGVEKQIPQVLNLIPFALANRDVALLRPKGFS